MLSMFALFVLKLFGPHAVSTLQVRRLLTEHVLPKDETHILGVSNYTTGRIAAALKRHSNRGYVAKRYAHGGPGRGTHVSWLLTPDGRDYVEDACLEVDQYWQDLLDSDTEIMAKSPFPSRYDWAGPEVIDLGNAGEFSEAAAKISKMNANEVLGFDRTGHTRKEDLGKPRTPDSN